MTEDRHGRPQPASGLMSELTARWYEAFSRRQLRAFELDGRWYLYRAGPGRTARVDALTGQASAQDLTGRDPVWRDGRRTPAPCLPLRHRMVVTSLVAACGYGPDAGRR